MEKDLWEYLKTTSKPIVLYGMGNGADKIIEVLEDKGIPFKGVFASDGFVRKKEFHGFVVTTYGELKEKFGEMIVLVCFGSSRPEVLENINRIASEQELYAPEVPVYGNGLFTNKYLSENKDEFKKVYSLLCDDCSKNTFENIINFKLSGKIQYLYTCEVSPDEPYGTFLHLNENETYLDIGAYNGDTALEFSNRVHNNYRKIYAVEPDLKSFRKLKANTAELQNIELINACISDTDGNESFSMRGGRNSSVGDGEIIKSVTVDSILNNHEVTYIKADVEGEELKMIAGAKSAILKSKPKMLISCYHRTDDLISIPNAVNAIRSDYKLFLRHYRYVPAWDTNYFFI